MSKKIEVVDNWQVCPDCLYAIANAGGYLVMSDEERDFSSKPCECCQDTLHGERFKCTVIIDNED